MGCKVPDIGSMGKEWRVGEILKLCGLDLNNPHFIDTPARWLGILQHYTQAYDPSNDLMKARFRTDEDCEGDIHTTGVWGSGMVVQGPIPYRGLCAHHLLPVTGHAFVAYIPLRYIVGLSKLSRVVYGITHKMPSIQERVGAEIVGALDEYLEPVGSACIIKADHGCMEARGVEEVGVRTTTASLSGVFRESSDARNELYSLIDIEAR